MWYLIDETECGDHGHPVEDDPEDGRTDERHHQQDRRDGDDHARNFPRPKRNLNKNSFYRIFISFKNV